MVHRVILVTIYHLPIMEISLIVFWLFSLFLYIAFGLFMLFYHFYSYKVAGIKRILRLLISKGGKVDAISNCGTPLHNAAAHGKKDSVRILLENHANVSKFLFFFNLEELLIITCVLLVGLQSKKGWIGKILCKT